MDETAIEQDYSKYHVLQPNASFRDYMWSLFNRIILKGGDSSTYSEMGRFVARYEGKDGNKYRRIEFKIELEGIREGSSVSSLKGVALNLIIMGSDKRCNVAMKYHGVKYPTDNLPEDLPIASDDYELGCCTCTTSLVARRDENGRLMLD